MENATWIAIGLVTGMYLRQRAPKPKPPPMQYEAEDDVTRYRYNDVQPTFDGNRRHYLDAQVLDLRSALAF